jgi:preprotein translocase subunit YajC
MVQLIILALLFAGMYFLLIAPQRQKEREQLKLNKELQKGDEVVTIGGVIGVIEKMSDERVTLRTAEKTVIEFQRAAVVGKMNQTKDARK